MNKLNSDSFLDFSYWFSNLIQDNNGVIVTDINEGIRKLIPDMIDQLNDIDNEHTRFMVPDCQIGMPDVAAKTFYDNESSWWYLCLGNQIVNPFKEYKNEFLYYAFTISILSAHDVNTNNNTNSKSKIGTVIELN